jgi:hypothetical protein
MVVAPTFCQGGADACKIMNPHTIPFIIMIISAVLAGVLAFIARRWRNTPGVNYFSALMLAVAILATADAVELIATALPDKITWSKLSYLGLINIAPLWLMFCLHFSHHTSQLTRGRVAALWVIPLTALVLAVTNEWHGLIWSTVKLITPLAGSLAIYELGAFYWIHIVYAYLLLLLGTYWLMQSAWHAPPLYQRQVAFLVIGALIPWAGNLLFIVRLNPWPGIDLTSIGLMLTGVFILAGISLYHTFDIAPVAREVLFNNLEKYL